MGIISCPVEKEARPPRPPDGPAKTLSTRPGRITNYETCSTPSRKFTLIRVFRNSSSGFTSSSLARSSIAGAIGIEPVNDTGNYVHSALCTFHSTFKSRVWFNSSEHGLAKAETVPIQNRDSPAPIYGGRSSSVPKSRDLTCERQRGQHSPLPQPSLGTEEQAKAGAP